ncbi:MAG: universal stress protein [Dehalococcoidia bacterium]
MFKHILVPLDGSDVAEVVDVAAVATHGRSGLSRTFFGSVADKLIRESGKPVLVVKAG